MSDIGGNITCMIQIKNPRTDKNGQPVKNAIGEQVIDWMDAQELTGWLDMMSGSSGYSAYNAKIQESTDVFLCDYIPLPQEVKAENARAVIGEKTYDVMLIDNPMGLDEQLEIFLKYTGGQ
jgi:hypothetical protein